MLGVKGCALRVLRVFVRVWGKPCPHARVAAAHPGAGTWARAGRLHPI